MFAKFLVYVGLLTADGSDKATPLLWLDEPETPASLIK